MPYNIVATALSQLGEKARDVIKKATREFAKDTVKLIEKKAEALGQSIDEKFLEENCPISMDICKDETWNLYTNQEPKEIFKECFYSIVYQVFQIEKL